MEALTTLLEVKGGEDDWDTADDEACQDAIEELSDDARYYGLETWTEPSVTPGPVCRMVRKAARRYMTNRLGLTASRAGDEMLGWDEQGERAGSPYFTDDEKQQLRSYRHAPGIYSVPLTAFGPEHRRSTAGYVPTESGKPFPLYPSEDGPW